MSDHDCFASPGVGPEFTQGNSDYDTFRPGEVRLYGRPAARDDENVTVQISELRTMLAEGKKDISDLVKRDDGEKPEVIRLIVRSSPSGNVAEARLGEIFENTLKISEVGAPEVASMGVIYGYAYEGHCYKLPKPQIMLLPVEPREIVEGDCGYKRELGYAVWQIDKLQRAVVLDVRSDDIKTLLLDANTPGSRSPMAYAAAMSLAPHRGGRD
ncbi:hypothetical protein [Chelativorans salis]|uniref:Uncharacterized protein n=1 Tax=Chelativorans salis TaxID=2978478 RepID=A0ABT2LW94_9HYPH|nr:hypothetical protein [Chelativorans sp. EGI FJ00035]MCT7377878.1 hypothetical protein [Chelativorans sp. EGI FJ00035]